MVNHARAAVVAACLVFAARTAAACPACTTRSSGGYMIPLLLGAFILTPYLVATVVLRIVRKAEAERLLEDRALGVAPAGDKA